jgi:hypothetical protein
MARARRLLSMPWRRQSNRRLRRASHVCVAPRRRRRGHVPRTDPRHRAHRADRPRGEDDQRVVDGRGRSGDLPRWARTPGCARWRHLDHARRAHGNARVHSVSPARGRHQRHPGVLERASARRAGALRIAASPLAPGVHRRSRPPARRRDQPRCLVAARPGRSAAPGVVHLGGLGRSRRSARSAGARRDPERPRDRGARPQPEPRRDRVAGQPARRRAGRDRADRRGLDGGSSHGGRTGIRRRHPHRTRPDPARDAQGRGLRREPGLVHPRRRPAGTPIPARAAPVAAPRRGRAAARPADDLRRPGQPRSPSARGARPPARRTCTGRRRPSGGARRHRGPAGRSPDPRHRRARRHRQDAHRGQGHGAWRGRTGAARGARRQDRSGMAGDRRGLAHPSRG